jgi:hypothetical protein
VASPEVLLEHTFRVWRRGRGKDYRVILTPTGLILNPCVFPDSNPPPFCCICPYSSACLARCCAGSSIEILGRDVVACRPAPNGGPFFPRGNMDKKKEKQLLKKTDPSVAGMGHSGTIHSSTIHSSTIHSSTIHSSTIHSSTIHSSTIYSTIKYIITV